MTEPVLKKGSTDPAVKDLQSALKALGQDPGPIDGIFGLPALSLGDLLATDLSDLFTTAPDPRPYDAAPPAGGSDRGGEPSPP